MDKDEYYRDILDGMAVYTGSTLLRDVSAVLARHDVPALGEALNKNQMGSKVWLADALCQSVGPRLRHVRILGGWIGVLAAVLLHDARFEIGHVTSIDIDPSCAPLALALNASHVRTGRFSAETADMLEIEYGSAGGADALDLIVNTSCEHLSEFGRWYGRVPEGALLVLQSNDYFSCAEHVNCVESLEAFRRQAPLAQTLYAGERKFRRYTRFMLIGRK